jgi:SAM-dependent methyltransferase
MLQRCGLDKRSRRFRREFDEFDALSANDSRFALKWADREPYLSDATATTAYERHYVLHPGWAARILSQTRPNSHVEISSSLYFIATVSAFVPIKYYDYRPAKLPLDGVTSEAANLMHLPFRDDELPSISCMHVIEHIGLGRYGDPLDATGDLKAAKELARVVAQGGHLLIVAPVGRPEIRFNAHRIYSYAQVLDMFSGLHLREFALIPDDPLEPELIRNARPERVEQQTYACGCFWFEKR